MKTMYAKEKSDYSRCLQVVMNKNSTLDELENAWAKMEEIEKFLKKQGDEILTIVTTKKTNPIPDKSAPPMEAS